MCCRHLCPEASSDVVLSSPAIEGLDKDLGKYTVLSRLHLSILTLCYIWEKQHCVTELGRGEAAVLDLYCLTIQRGSLKYTTLKTCAKK